ncbi:MAG: hypothetical protein AAB499_00885, partial [Patescibacteria group bacterium]
MEEEPKVPVVFGLIRLALGFVFLWSFLDKMWGLGFATEAGKAVVDGVSPTSGFLKFGVQGPFAELFQGLAGNGLVDWLYMLGMLGVGLALIFGVMTRFTSWIGVLLMLLIYLAVLPPEHNPVVDEHVIYILILLALPAMKADQSLG